MHWAAGFSRLPFLFPFFSRNNALKDNPLPFFSISFWNLVFIVFYSISLSVFWENGFKRFFAAPFFRLLFLFTPDFQLVSLKSNGDKEIGRKKGLNRPPIRKKWKRFAEKGDLLLSTSITSGVSM